MHRGSGKRRKLIHKKKITRRRPRKRKYIERCPWCGSPNFNPSPRSNGASFHDLMRCTRCHKDFFEGGAKVIWREKNSWWDSPW